MTCLTSNSESSTTSNRGLLQPIGTSVGTLTTIFEGLSVPNAVFETQHGHRAGAERRVWRSRMDEMRRGACTDGTT